MHVEMFVCDVMDDVKVNVSGLSRSYTESLCYRQAI